MAEDISRLRIEKGAGPKGYKRRRRAYLYWALAAAAVVALLLVATGVLSGERVRTATVSLTYPSQGLTVLNASGYVVAERKAALASKITGRLVWVGVEEGSQVKAGQVVARLEAEDLSAALDQARAALKAARQNLASARAELKDAGQDHARKKELAGRGFVPRSAFESAEARLRKAEAAAEAARAEVSAADAGHKGAEASLGYSEIRAPFSAVVLTKNADIGDIVSPLGAAAGAKAAVVTIADMETLQVEADVSESNIGMVSIGMPCEIQLDAFPDRRFRGLLHMIVPTADRTKASVLVKVRFLDREAAVVPEMSARVSFLSRALASGEDAPRTTVPSSAVVKAGGASFVFVVEGNRARKAQVTVKGFISDYAEVAGVEPGASVVLSPPGRLGDGDKVEVIEE